jgi:FixJ family two-component response regulator
VSTACVPTSRSERSSTNRTRVASRFHNACPDSPPGERSVYALIIKGHPNKYVALKLDVSLRTVERRFRRVLDKLDVDTLPELLQLLADIQQVDISRSASPSDGSDEGTR